MKKRKHAGWLLALPGLLALGAGCLVPLALAFYKSLFAGMSTNFVGLENYTDLFVNDAFGLAVKNLLRLAFFFPGILPAACVVMMAAEGASLLGWESS